MTKRRILLKIEIFVIIFAVILSSVTFVMRNKEACKNIIPFYDEPKSSLDVIFLGTSHVINAVNPMQLYDEYGICSYNYSSDSTPLLLSYYALKNIAKNQTFKIACINLLGIQYTTENDYRAWNDLYPWFHLFVDGIPIILDKVILTNQYLNERKDNFSIYFEANMPIYRFHSRWTYLKDKDFFQFDDFQKGYSPNFKNNNISSPLIIPKNNRMELYAKQYSTIKSIIDFCKLNGIKLIFTVIPYGQKYGTNKLLHQYNEISYLLENEKNVSYLNYFNYFDELKLNLSTDFADESHVNPNGAQKITAHLGKYIKEHYDIPDRRLDPVYVKWNDDYKLYVQDTFAQELNATKNSEKYLELLTSKKDATDNTCIFVVKTSEKNINSKHFNSLGINGNTNNCITIIDEGKVVYNRTASDVPLQHEYKIGRLPIKLVSDVKRKTSSIKIDGIEQINNKSGITVVIYDKLLKKVSSVRSL